jgi:hypothetical protein
MEILSQLLWKLAGRSRTTGYGGVTCACATLLKESRTCKHESCIPLTLNIRYEPRIAWVTEIQSWFRDCLCPSVFCITWHQCDPLSWAFSHSVLGRMPLHLGMCAHLTSLLQPCCQESPHNNIQLAQLHDGLVVVFIACHANRISISAETSSVIHPTYVHIPPGSALGDDANGDVGIFRCASGKPTGSAALRASRRA